MLQIQGILFLDFFETGTRNWDDVVSYHKSITAQSLYGFHINEETLMTPDESAVLQLFFELIYLCSTMDTSAIVQMNIYVMKTT